MPNSGVSQSSCPALQVVDSICLSQSVFIFMAKSFLICETVELWAGQPSLSPAPQPSPLLLLSSQLPLSTKLGAAAPGLATLKMTLAQQWELGDSIGGFPGKPCSRATTLGIAGVNFCFSPFLVFQRGKEGGGGQGRDMSLCCFQNEDLICTIFLNKTFPIKCYRSVEVD